MIDDCGSDGSQVVGNPAAFAVNVKETQDSETENQDQRHDQGIIKKKSVLQCIFMFHKSSVFRLAKISIFMPFLFMYENRKNVYDRAMFDTSIAGFKRKVKEEKQ